MDWIDINAPDKFRNVKHTAIQHILAYVTMYVDELNGKPSYLTAHATDKDAAVFAIQDVVLEYIKEELEETEWESPYDRVLD